MTMLFRASPIRPFRLVPVAALLLATPRDAGCASEASGGESRQSGAEPRRDASRSSAYYHYGLAHLYEEMAVNAGRPDYANAGGGRVQAGAGRRSELGAAAGWAGRSLLQDWAHQDAVTAAQDQVKRNPDDVEAHTLLGQVYLRSLSDTQGGQSGADAAAGDCGV